MNLPEVLQTLFHENVPHARGAIYLSSAIFSGAAVMAVYLRAWWTKSTKYLENRWIGRTAMFAAPFPVYTMMLLAPIDQDLLKAMMEDYIIVALAGLYGVSEVINDIRNVAGRAAGRLKARRGEVAPDQLPHG